MDMIGSGERENRNGYIKEPALITLEGITSFHKADRGLEQYRALIAVCFTWCDMRLLADNTWAFYFTLLGVGISNDPVAFK